MTKTRPSVLLNQLILEKEAEHKLEGKALKAEFKSTFESLKPINIIKNTLKQAASSPDLKKQVVNAGIGIATGFVAKKLVIGNSNNLLTKLMGTLVESFVANKAEKNADDIKSLGGLLIKKAMEHYSAK